MRRGLSAIGLALLLSGCGLDAVPWRADGLDGTSEPDRVGGPAAPPPGPPPGPPKAPIPVVAPGPEPGPEPGTLPPGWYVPEAPVAPEPPEAQPAPMDPDTRTAALLRQNAWIARFWSELTPAEQARVTRALARRGAGGAAPTAWDPMGLQERVDLLFGPLRAAG